MRIGLLHIGDELLAGKILNTNGRDAALWLADLGHEAAFALTLGDDRAAIAAALRDGLDAPATLPRCGMLILTGGLGPTQDDLTREALSAFLGAPLRRSEQAAEWMAARHGIPAGQLTEGQKIQLAVPEGVTPLFNPAGTACGLGFERNGVRVFAFPGVPSEFKAMFEAHCRPLLERRDARLLRRRAVTFGLSESRQRDLLRDFVPPPPFRFSSLPNPSGVTIALEAFVPETEVLDRERALNQAWRELLERLPPESIVARDGSTLPQTVFRLLCERKATVAVAESCTAGALGFLLTEVPGSSAVFHQGYLTYANEAKSELLGVSRETLLQHGAVSAPVARLMAKGCWRASRADYALAVTGIAGPDGGSAEKPVGLVYIAVEGPNGSECHRFQFRGDRNSIRWQTAYNALNLLRLLIFKDLESQK